MRTLTTLAFAVLLLAGPAAAAEAPPAPEAPAQEAPVPEVPPDTPAAKARRGLDLLLQALEGWINQLPSYAPPEVMQNGDIIIRRLDRPPSPPSPPSAPPPGGPAAPGAAPGGATRL
ncbi:hypothetical protein [Azospirillum sp. ST 5-10]|uniref:hypothetical protein n=1 Tax=unclassified Azospirillum TaxID=2630922 RepID=UPI003F4A115D